MPPPIEWDVVSMSMDCGKLQTVDRKGRVMTLRTRRRVCMHLIGGVARQSTEQETVRHGCMKSIAQIQLTDCIDAWLWASI